jgi:hypothetical protein
MFSSGQFLLGRILKSATSGFASEAKAVEVENFFKDKDTPGAERSISQVSLLCFAVHAVMVVPRAAVRGRQCPPTGHSVQTCERHLGLVTRVAPSYVLRRLTHVPVQALETIRMNAGWLERDRSAVKAWLAANV